MAGFFDSPMFTSPTDIPAPMRYPGTDFLLLPRSAYNTPWPPLTAGTPSLPPTAASAAAPPPTIPRVGPPLPLAPPALTPNAVSAAPPGVPTSGNIGFNNPLTSHAATLMALGAGIAQGGIGKGLAMASAAADNERNRQLQQMSFMQAYKALTDSGVPQQEAIAAVSNPSLMRTLAARFLGARAQANATGRTAGPASSGTQQPPPVAWQDAAGGQPSSAPSLAGVHRAPDGNFYAPDPSRPGKYMMVR